MASRAYRRKVTHRPPSQASVRGLLRALAELHGVPVPMTSDEMLAERERLRQETDAAAGLQGQLVLRARGS